ncbi:hypothetical protein M086_2076, partial [Bacteroides fragilis str. S13 L11]
SIVGYSLQTVLSLYLQYRISRIYGREDLRIGYEYRRI